MITSSEEVDLDFRFTSVDEMFINVDLIGLIPIYLKHLDAWKDFADHEEDRGFMEKCLERYEKLWLPLLAQYGSVVEPPSDVHWMWHLHLLQPCKYVVYCKKRFNRILHHKFQRSKTESKSIKNRTKQIWLMLYPEEPFEPNLKQLITSEKYSDFNYFSELNYLLSSVKYEKDFNYSCELPHLRDQTFQLSAVCRYKRYLYLKQHYPHWQPCRSPIDIVLIWRVHLMHPSNYISDVLRIIDNNNNQTDFATYLIDQNINYPQKDLFPNLMRDNTFWNSIFPEDEFSFFANGTIPRKSLTYAVESCIQVLKEFPGIRFEQENIEECHMTFEGLSITDLWSRQKNIKVVACLLGANSFQQQVIFQTKGWAESSFKDANKRLLKWRKSQKLGECRFVRGENRGIELQIYVGNGFGVFSRYKQIAKKAFNPMHYIKYPQNKDNQQLFSQSKISICQEVDIPKVTYTDPSIKINYSLEFSKRNPFSFVLDRNQAEASEIPDYLRGYLSNVFTWQIAINDSEEYRKFMIARHSIKCRDYGIAFGVEVVRHERYNLNAILAFHNNASLVAVAFSIDSGYLPTSSQVMETCPLTFDPDKGDVAMMVQKANRQDFIIVASFKDECQKGDRTMLFKTYSAENKRCYSVEVKVDELQTISNSTACVDLPTGRIVIKDTAQRIPDNIAWVFSVGCMFLSIQRNAPNNLANTQSHSLIGINNLFSGSVRSSSTQLSTEVGNEDNGSVGNNPTKKRLTLAQMKRNRRQLKRRKMSASFTFLLACGLRFDSSMSLSSSNIVWPNYEKEIYCFNEVKVTTQNNQTLDSDVIATYLKKLDTKESNLYHPFELHQVKNKKIFSNETSVDYNAPGIEKNNDFNTRSAF